MPINCTNCHGELDPAYFDTRCDNCLGHFDKHVATTDTHDGYCLHTDIHTDNCPCGEFEPIPQLCETCEARARNQASYDNLTPWQRWNR